MGVDPPPSEFTGQNPMDALVEYHRAGGTPIYKTNQVCCPLDSILLLKLSKVQETHVSNYA